MFPIACQFNGSLCVDSSIHRREHRDRADTFGPFHDCFVYGVSVMVLGCFVQKVTGAGSISSRAQHETKRSDQGRDPRKKVLFAM